MPQTSYQAQVTSKDAADQLVADTESVQGVKWVNVNIDQGTIVVTHSEDYDEAAFKSAAGI
ncbi:hypothetical protein J3492_07320 [Psychrobacter sp. F1192]|uniref:HMA domain-containing protein n=1 Tax=Psychrobacter coccoides TaxID=2818440 RepID=A0ABS3NNN1_9GAMM|nr:hypothetical protein [Psychrobacter coccoides]MBO1531024.1 hypothetical protein [Psychrobacter coccoides]